jgi:hypothetical protein
MEYSLADVWNKEVSLRPWTNEEKVLFHQRMKELEELLEGQPELEQLKASLSRPQYCVPKWLVINFTAEGKEKVFTPPQGMKLAQMWDILKDFIPNLAWQDFNYVTNGIWVIVETDRPIADISYGRMRATRNYEDCMVILNPIVLESFELFSYVVAEEVQHILTGLCPKKELELEGVNIQEKVLKLLEGKLGRTKQLEALLVQLSRIKAYWESR